MRLEVIMLETYFAGYRYLVGGDATLKEVGEFLHVLQFHEAEGILAAEDGLHAEANYARIGNVFEILAHLANRKTGNAT
jgi:hypothetical protein